MGEESPAPAKVYYDGCPGCAMDRKKETQSGVPYKELLFVATTTFASGTTLPTPDADAPPATCSAPSISLSVHPFQLPRPDQPDHVVRGRTTHGLILLPACYSLVRSGYSILVHVTVSTRFGICFFMLDWTLFLLGQAGGAMAATDTE